MACDHCCFECSPRKGEHTNPQTVEDTLQFIHEQARCSGELYMTLGGGEPTLHPQFFEVLPRLLADRDIYLHIVTNGKNKARAMRFIDFQESYDYGDRLIVRMSSDPYHDTPDYGVFSYYRDKKRLNVANYISPIGRGKSSVFSQFRHPWRKEDVCPCEAFPFIDPSGRLFACGCKDLVLGDVRGGFSREFQQVQRKFEDRVSYFGGHKAKEALLRVSSVARKLHEGARKAELVRNNLVQQLYCNSSQASV